MSFNLDCKKGSKAMESAKYSLDKTEEALKTVEKAMDKYAESLKNEITDQAELILKSMKKNIEDARSSLDCRTQNVRDAIRTYEDSVKKGL